MIVINLDDCGEGVILKISQSHIQRGAVVLPISERTMRKLQHGPHIMLSAE
jgi:hypothetical protein